MIIVGTIFTLALFIYLHIYHHIINTMLYTYICELLYTVRITPLHSITITIEV